MIILKRIFEHSDGSMDWSDMAQDRDRWRALVSRYFDVSLNYRYKAPPFYVLYFFALSYRELAKTFL
jgi:hypothetical protein